MDMIEPFGVRRQEDPSNYQRVARRGTRACGYQVVHRTQGAIASFPASLQPHSRQPMTGACAHASHLAWYLNQTC
jgi:hypothetical protein